MRVVRHPDAHAFLDRAESWLVDHEVENNLILGIARAMLAETARWDEPIYLATIEQEESTEVVGAAFRTPPAKLGLTAMPLEAIPALVADAHALYGSLPAVLGPVPVARAFADQWAAVTGAQARDGMAQRLFVLHQVTPTTRLPPGRMRSADEADLPLAVEWIHRFSEDAGIEDFRLEERAAGLVAAGDLVLWEDGSGRPVSMAAVNGRSGSGARVGYVYTPPDLRGRGYASACVAALSQQLLDSGLAWCALYTDLANPTSNKIYQQIGYRPVLDTTDVLFETPSR